MSEDLKPCPYCLSNCLKLVMNRNVCGTNGLDWIVERHRWYVRCNCCKSRGPVASGRVIPGHRFDDYRDLAEWQTTDERLKKRAAEAWNRRANRWTGIS